MKIEIREAMISDLPAILLLYAHLGMDDCGILTLKEAKKIFKKLKKYPDYKLYVVVKSGEIIGSFALLIMDNIGHKGAPSGIIENVIVHPAYRRIGVGTKMMKFAIDYCRKQGCYKVALSSNMNRTDAHAFYESIGFKLHGYSFIIENLEHKKEK